MEEKKEMEVRKLLGKYAMTKYLADRLDEELLPICITHWLLPGKDLKTGGPRPENEIMTLQPEYKEMTSPIVLSVVKKTEETGKIFTGRRLLFDELDTAFRFLLKLPPSFRNYFILVPEDQVIALYFDLDKANDDFWRDHPNYSWDETLRALIVIVEEAWKQLTGSNEPPPPWYEELYCFTSTGKSKILSKHLHTTQDPNSRCFFGLPSRKSLHYFLIKMREVVREAYHDEKSQVYKAARILSHEKEVEVETKDGKKEMKLSMNFIFDVNGSGSQWRLPFCQKPGGVPLLPDFEYDERDMGRILRIGYPVRPKERAAKIPKEKLIDFAPQPSRR